jgi:hypothetical protein
MCICHDKKIIFIHIPKNAGTSVLSYLNTSIENILPDSNWEDYYYQYKKYWDSHTKFSIIRNPYCRFKSIYRHLRLRSNINEFANLVKEKSFMVAKPQSQFICDENKIIVDKLIRYENLNQELEKIGIYNFPQKNKSKIISNDRLQMNEKTVKIINQIYKKDFEILGYEYN